ncbi:MAG: helicase [Candidatus Vogelbacteria bacterium CG10_big_fil_rev_8_21_14_0_10_49_38]|uniref:Helicase n=1 Tax=Candidatus Vogelbacteria bacterium CG10_big_fil_rev_8_21_14_0_10_49_38 TaxID=1975043 RepID=A0A2H0RIH9_9BACT|nr:MAG: helicase [Candidatus Vogelbacteria bacterium CG10_big_fil_rev_8_21_14_0_10_49_38]
MTQAEALEILQAGHNVFITGAAGSGKTHLLNTYLNYLKNRGVEPGITASTGIAATHLGGQTIHAWSGLGVRDKLSAQDIDDLEAKSYLWKRLSRAKVLVIDEISMLDHSRLDLLDRLLRSFKRTDEPFGGVQMIFCGDFFQLPPVSRGESRVKFAYQAEAWRALEPKICYLEEQYRQQDEAYLKILNEIRAGQVSAETVKRLRSRLDAKMTNHDPARLYTHNVDVDEENGRELSRLAGEIFTYQMSQRGSDRLAETLKKGCLAPETLRLKEGARVMFVKNNFDAGYVNGTLGVVAECRASRISVRLVSGRLIEAEPAFWRIEEEGKMKAEINQYPLRLAWAITVHKSQGLSLEAAEVDLTQAFEPGMGYVALSRVRTLDGLSLRGLNDLALRVSEEVLERDQDFREASRRHLDERGRLSAEKKTAEREKFLRRIGAGEPGSKHPAKTMTKKVGTLELTRQLLDEGQTLAEMAAARGLSADTILEHLEKIKIAEPQVPLRYLLNSLPVARAKKIRQALTAGGMTGGYYPLGPAKNRLGPGFSYAEIRLVRLML